MSMASRASTTKSRLPVSHHHLLPPPPSLQLFLPPLLLFLFTLFLATSTSNNILVDGATSRIMLLSKAGCNQSEVLRVDRLVARLLPFGPKGRLMPQNDAQLVAFCAESRNLTLQVETFFSRCLARDALQTSKLALYPPKRSVQQFCGTSLKEASKIGLPALSAVNSTNSSNSNSSQPLRKSKRLEKILRVTPCVNRHLRRNDTCLRHFVAALKTVMMGVTEERLKLPHLCCSAVSALHCLEDMLERKACSRAAASREVILDFMATSSADFFGVACGDFGDAGSDRCASLAPLNVTSSNLVSANLIGGSSNSSRKSTGKTSKRRAKATKQKKLKAKKLRGAEKQKLSGKIISTSSLAEMNLITPVFLVIDLLSNLGG